MLIREFITHLDSVLPLGLAMEDDPVGMQVLAEDKRITTIAVAYELNEEIVELAYQAGAGLIVAFHPLLFPALQHITPDSRVERTVIQLIQKGIGLYVVHTALDAHPEGTSMLLARSVGLRDLSFLRPSPRYDWAGMGAVGNLDEPVSISVLAERVKLACNAATVRVSALPGFDGTRMVQRVALHGGSGMSFYADAVAMGADAFVTADVRYHAFHAANDGIPVLDPGHAETEIMVVPGLTALLRQAVKRSGAAMQILPLEVSTNPVRYYV